tara:strand:+ start:42 stop:440 length:399 start_codon:yes stop_codon:yes gene_type:complete
MCFFGGGGGEPATITKPDYTAYNQQFDLQKAAIENQINNQNTTLQSSLHSALSDKQDALAQLAVASQARANATSKAAMQLSQVAGPPPREKHAQPPKTGVDDRGIKTKKGKSSLRIGKTSKKYSQGSGLNIT